MIRSTLTPQQVGEVLQISRTKFYSMAISGRLSAFKVGRQWRLNDFELQQWIDLRIRPKNACERSGRTEPFAPYAPRVR